MGSSQWTESNKHFRKIVLINTGEVFTTTTEINNKYPSINRSTVFQCCRNKATYSGHDENGYALQWCYYEDYIQGDYVYHEGLKYNHKRLS